MNAIINAALDGISLKDCGVACTYSPCYSCAKQLVNLGINEFVYEIPYDDEKESCLVKELFERFSTSRIRPQKTSPIKPANTTSCGQNPKVFHRKKFLSTPSHRPRHNPYSWGVQRLQLPPIGAAAHRPPRKQKGPEPQKPRAHSKTARLFAPTPGPAGKPPAQHRFRPAGASPDRRDNPRGRRSGKCRR